MHMPLKMELKICKRKIEQCFGNIKEVVINFHAEEYSFRAVAAVDLSFENGVKFDFHKGMGKHEQDPRE